MKKFFVYKCKLSWSLALLYLVDLFINKLKTKFNNLFYRTILNTKRIYNVPARAKQTPSKVLFVIKKKTTAAVRSSRPKIVIYQQLFRYIFKRKKNNKKQQNKYANKTKQKRKKRKKGKRRSLAGFEPGTFGLTRPLIATTPLRMVTWFGEKSQM